METRYILATNLNVVSIPIPVWHKELGIYLTFSFAIQYIHIYCIHIVVWFR